MAAPGGRLPGVLPASEKRGRTVMGWAEIEVHARPGGRSRVVWREDVRVRFLPAACDGLLARAGHVMFGRATDRLLRRG